jgi:subtilisin family serine protease
MKHKTAKTSTPITKLLLLLLALSILFTATQCAQPSVDQLPTSEHVPDVDLYAECDDTPGKELGAPDDFACHTIIVSMKVGYGDKVYTVEDFPEIECEDVRVIMVARTPAAKERFSQMLTLTLAIHSKKYVLEAVELLKQREDVAFPEPSYYLEPDTIPNDPAYVNGQQWAINKIQLPDAWDVTTGSNTILVGVIDTGIIATHTDFSGKINTALSQCFSPVYSDPFGDELGHGTKIAGVIGAATNNSIGIAGVGWNVQLVSLRVESADHKFDANASVAAVEYATKIGIPVLNYSGSGSAYNENMYTAIMNYPGIFICAAGNDNTNIDSAPRYPACYDLPNIICVGATDSLDTRWYTSYDSASNFGANSVDLYAPGTNIYTTTKSGGYANASGTSLAVPHVAGVAALMLSVRPHLTSTDIKSLLMSSVTSSASIASTCVSGGRLNAYNALLQTIQTHSYTYADYNETVHIASCACGNHSEFQDHDWALQATEPQVAESSPDYIPTYICIQCGRTSLQPLSQNVTH